MKGKKEDLEEELIREYEIWENLRDNGSMDPFYDDEYSMNLIRSRIICAKKQLEEKYGDDRGMYPEVYFRELPPEIENGYMAGAGYIRKQAEEVLDRCLSDDSFQYILCHKERLDEKEAAGIRMEKVLGYVSGLAWALREDDLTAMCRQIFKQEYYQESFVQCAQKMEKIISAKEQEMKAQETCGQMAFFQRGIEDGQCR